MPKATLSFNLPEEQEEYNTTMKAGNYSHFIWEFDQMYLRANTKHGIQGDTVQKVLEELKGYYSEGETPKEYNAEEVARIAEATFDVIRTAFYEYMNEHEANPFV